ncbi:MAG: hypothetical protein ACRERD_30910 [Candidatus Binatia bacterium]
MARWRRRYDDDYDAADWYRDVADYSHDYADDWTDRADDFEGDVRNAFSSLFGNRGGGGGRRRHDGGDPYYDRPPRAMRRGVRTEDILQEAGFFEVLKKVEELTKKVEELAAK